ncbi:MULTISPECIES: cobalamin B12-binding domain-containing protein [unclassified Candidatus Frackibacter]|uniref:cobalamin B12-binding domain-containing protein n=1 Tax=unclassified Candidatus Frackibacter TaxID=2648818 RepID=UPI0008827F6E|nr:MULTISPECIES: cobalamin-dependent protein [unclassified Candidatus Frackibacter]SDC27100.1 Methanogenic corrinoid protein MtbC1 [Candidatus Frackibacter sp. WG11]SEM54094.1 Methanogenic corrinoid protein MtbC1 [Candidatus Frackibacter sp. WG12]SFL54305.1 Methanogenic corrinoid protein MtbC1 [Candidatus Frackibacter sp. WG13]
MSKNLVELMADLREDEALDLIKSQIEDGTNPREILEDCKEAMQIIGDRFEAGEYFLPELMLSGEMINDVMEIIKPHLKDEEEDEKLGTIVLGTVKGDIHDIGKDIVAFMLDINGFEVYDIGVDVSVQEFIDKIEEVDPDIVALSGFLTTVFDKMKDTIDAIKSEGLREDVKIMIGGGPIDDQIREYTGADAFGDDAMEAVAIAKKWMGE